MQLVPLTAANLGAVLTLEVTRQQKNYICSNAHTIAWCYVAPTKVPLVAQHKGTPVGLLAYEQEPEPGHYDILTMMIGSQYQNRGLGKAAFTSLLEHLQNLPDCQRITLNFVPGNQRAEAFYRSFGFVPTGQHYGDEIVMELFVNHCR